MKQELSYRKQIARQLRTQYAEGIYYNPVTLKSRLTVTQGHWKRNHRVNHVYKLTSYWTLNIIVTLKRGSKVTQVIEISAIRKLGCGFLFVFYSNCDRICSRL